MVSASRRDHSRRLRTSDRGLVLVYYGDGKGKTTAALGAVLRASGQGWHCAVIQFIKGSWPSSEREAISRYLGTCVTIEAGGKGFVGIVNDRLPRSVHKQAARALFRKVQRLFRTWNAETRNTRHGTTNRRLPQHLHLSTHHPRLVVLDELLDAVELGFVSPTEVVRLLRQKPPHLHLILTGHKMFPGIVAVADLVTRMTKEKHPYDQGYLAVRGLDY